MEHAGHRGSVAGMSTHRFSVDASPVIPAARHAAQSAAHSPAGAGGASAGAGAGAGAGVTGPSGAARKRGNSRGPDALDARSSELEYYVIPQHSGDGSGYSGDRHLHGLREPSTSYVPRVLVNEQGVPQLKPQDVLALSETEGGADATWGWGSRPRGLLVATLKEHTAAVTSLAVAQDHSFFVTASDDGTVNLWESRGIDTDVAKRARGTYRPKV